MDVTVINRFASHLPPDDTHPYRTGPWRPNTVEYDASNLPVEGEIPKDLSGVYLRNTENPYVYAMLGKPGWFLFHGLVKYDLQQGTQDRYMFEPHVYASEAPMAPRIAVPSSTPGDGEDDGYLLTYTVGMRRDRSECWIFDAKQIARGPLARVRLPERIRSGTHACWYPTG